ncbi:hypothetical protein DAMA08_000330 [Martiniozyma asiatica (nom. inval.)]|nr:hypothetical protein DAMA08_000330 [Martiniozyma asiatica]
MASILGPTVLLLALAYPSLYWSVSSGITSADLILKDVSITEIRNNENETHMGIRSFVLGGVSGEKNVLTVDNWNTLLHFQRTLTRDFDKWEGVTLFTPLCENMDMKAIQNKSWSKYLELLGGVTLVDGLIKSADSLRIVVLYEKTQEFEYFLNQNINDSLKYLNNSFNSFDFKIDQDFKLIDIDPPHSYSNTNSNTNSNPNSNPNSNTNSLAANYKIVAHKTPTIEKLIFFLLPYAALLYILISLTNVQTVKSRLGLLFAQLIQITLSIFASATICVYVFNDILLHQIPLTILLVVPLIITIENNFNLIINVTKISDELDMISRIFQGYCNSIPLAVSIVAWTCFLLLKAGLVAPSPYTKQYCLFTMLCLFFDLFLHSTFFITILSVDLKRLELEDLLHKSRQNDQNYQNNENLAIKHMESFKNHRSMIGPLFLDEFNFEGFDLSYRHILGQFLLKVKLPIFNTLKPTLAIIFPLSLYIIIFWTNAITISTYDNVLDIFPNKRGFVAELMKLSNYKNLIITTYDPIIIPNNVNQHGVIYKFDLFFIIEFFSFLLFVCSSSILALKLSIDESVTNYASLSVSDFNRTDDGFPKFINFNFKELIDGHILDIVKVCATDCPFVVTVGMDHRVLVWSPMSSPIPTPTHLPIPNRFMPITTVSMSNSGSLISLFSKSGEIKCWSRLSMSWAWSIEINELENDLPLETFFRRKRSTTTGGRRKLVSRSSRKVERISEDGELEISNSNLNLKSKSKKNSDASCDSPSGCSSNVSSITLNTQNDPSSFERKGRIRSSSGSNLLPYNRSMSMDSNFDQSSDLTQLTLNSKMEFVIVLKDGAIFTVDCQTGEIKKTILSSNPLLSVKKLSSPRVNDRIVGIDVNADLVVATSINNKWISRPVKVDSSSYNKGKSLITPAVLSSYEQFTNSDTDTNTNTNEKFKKKVEFDDKKLDELKGIVMETVPFVGMIVRAYALKAQLIDVQTGILLKEWPIGQFKSSTFKVFHPEPKHCKFCGCASVATFSVAYTELETNMLIMHTFSIDNRAKNSICLRVERDSRETRCLGFASATDHQHWLSNVEGWSPTDLNMLMGVRRKERADDSDNTENLYSDTNGHNLRTSVGQYVDTNGRVRNRYGNEEIKNKKKGNSVSLDLNNSPKLGDIWEGWTMTADGQVRFYEIPHGSSSGLLIKSVGHVQKFGHKSIIVSFGNIMKIFYLGNDNLIEGEPDTESLDPLNQNSSSLSFINRRRKLRMKKYELTHSTNFGDGIISRNV